MGIDELKEKIREIKNRIESLGKEIEDLESIHKGLSKAIEQALDIGKQIDRWTGSILDSADSALPDGGCPSETFAAVYKKELRSILGGADIEEAKSSLAGEGGGRSFVRSAGSRLLDLEDEIEAVKGVLQECKDKLQEFENWLKDLLGGGD